MKRIPSLILACLLVVSCGSGCATADMLRETKPHSKYNPETKTYDEVPANKAAYAVVPFGVLLDMFTVPFVLPYFLAIKLSGSSY